MQSTEWAKAKRLARELPIKKYKKAARHRLCQALQQALAADAQKTTH